MSKAYESIKRGLEEALEFAQGRDNGTKLHVLPRVNVKNLRLRTGLTENDFAAAIGISINTLRGWERGVRNPRGPALVLLHLVDKDPQTMRKVKSLSKSLPAS